MLYELVTKTRLFHREDQFQALTAVTSDEPVQPASVRNPEVPPELSDILSIALQKNADDRYQDAGAFHSALEGWLKNQANSPTSSDVGEFMHKLFSQRINARAKLIESASMGELTPSSARDAIRHDTDHSMPGRTGNRTAARPSHSPQRAALVLIPSALALVLSGVLLARMLIRRDDPVVTDDSGAAQPKQQAKKADTPPPPQLGTLVVETEPPGADVTVDGKSVGPSPVTLPEKKLGKYDIGASMPGYKPMGTKLSLSEAGGQAKVLLPLQPEEKPQQAQAQPPVQQPPKPRPPPPPPVQMGKLSLSTQPWTKASLNGKALGDTPLIDLPLPAGKFLIKLVNEEKNVNTSVEVEIKGGQTTKKVMQL